MVEYIDLALSEISEVKNLWNCNKQYHIEIEKYFKEQYTRKTFTERVNEIIASNDEIITTIAKENEITIGYCISGIKSNSGEVISMHVTSENRNNGIGKELIQRHLKWMKEKGCCRISVCVASINESSIMFYEKNGFVKNHVLMEIVEQKNVV